MTKEEGTSLRRELMKLIKERDEKEWRPFRPEMKLTEEGKKLDKAINLLLVKLDQ